MKKIAVFMAFTVLAVLLTGCGEKERPNAEVFETQPTSARVTVEYSIPADAKGPGDVTLPAGAYDDYPEDKRPDMNRVEIQVAYWYVNSKGLHQEFDVIEGETEATVENITALLCDMGVLADNTQAIDYTLDETSLYVVLNQMEGVSSYATEELLAQAITNTYIDNLMIDTVTIEVEDKTYGPLEYKD